MTIARISEIFKSVQGEGIYTGREQLFVRFFGCNISCSFCDTPLKSFREYTKSELKEEILPYAGSFHSLCLTGGEPLCQADFIPGFLNEIESLGLRVYLETNGILFPELAKVIDLIDIIAMDFKLDSSAGCGDYLPQHEEFLKIASQKEVFIKIVICRQTCFEEIKRAARIIHRIKPDMAVVLQPNWFELDHAIFEKMRLVKEMLEASGLANVKILVQAHKFSGVK